MKWEFGEYTIDTDKSLVSANCVREFRSFFYLFDSSEVNGLFQYPLGWPIREAFSGRHIILYTVYSACISRNW